MLYFNTSKTSQGNIMLYFNIFPSLIDRSFCGIFQSRLYHVVKMVVMNRIKADKVVTKVVEAPLAGAEVGSSVVGSAVVGDFVGALVDDVGAGVDTTLSITA